MLSILVLYEALPSYWLVQASHEGRGEGGWAYGWLVMAIWTVVLTALAVRAYQHDTKRAG